MRGTAKGSAVVWNDGEQLGLRFTMPQNLASSSPSKRPWSGILPEDAADLNLQDQYAESVLLAALDALWVARQRSSSASEDDELNTEVVAAAIRDRYSSLKLEKRSETDAWCARLEQLRSAFRNVNRVAATAILCALHDAVTEFRNDREVHHKQIEGLYEGIRKNENVMVEVLRSGTKTDTLGLSKREAKYSMLIARGVAKWLEDVMKLHDDGLEPGEAVEEGPFAIDSTLRKQIEGVPAQTNKSADGSADDSPDDSLQMIAPIPRKSLKRPRATIDGDSSAAFPKSHPESTRKAGFVPTRKSSGPARVPRVGTLGTSSSGPDASPQAVPPPPLSTMREAPQKGTLSTRSPALPSIPSTAPPGMASQRTPAAPALREMPDLFSIPPPIAARSRVRVLNAMTACCQTYKPPSDTGVTMLPPIYNRNQAGRSPAPPTSWRSHLKKVRFAGEPRLDQSGIVVPAPATVVQIEARPDNHDIRLSEALDLEGAPEHFVRVVEERAKQTTLHAIVVAHASLTLTIERMLAERDSRPWRRPQYVKLRYPPQ